MRHLPGYLTATILAVLLSAPFAADADRARTDVDYLAGEATFKACTNAVMTMGGMGYAKEFHVERYFRECLIHRLAPVSPQLILCHIAERALGLPREPGYDKEQPWSAIPR